MSVQTDKVLDESAEQIDEFKSDHSGGGPVKGAEIEDAESKNAEDPKANGKKKKMSEPKHTTATKVDMKVEEDESSDEETVVEDEAPATKSGMINKVLDEMKGKSKSELDAIYAGIISAINEEDDEDDDEEDIDDEEDEKDMKKESKKVTKEDLDLSADVSALFEGEELSEEFKTKATTIFEAAVVSKVNQKLEEVTEENDSELTEAKSSLVEEMSKKVDSYLEYVVQEWVEANELAIESGIRAELAEDFINGLKGLFEDHYIDIPEDKVDVVEEMGNRIVELESQLDEQINEKVELSKEVAGHKKDDILEEIASGLVDTDAEKLRSLAEGVDFEGEEDYRNKLSVLKENYFPVDGKKVDLSEEVSEEPVDDGSDSGAPGPMSHYVNAISRTTVKR